jgi:hypothetical protein
MPRIPPIKLPKMDHIDKNVTPKIVGIYPPIIDPITIPNIIIDFEDIIYIVALLNF